MSDSYGIDLALRLLPNRAITPASFLCSKIDAGASDCKMGDVYCMVGYREMPNLRNAVRAPVLPFESAGKPIGNLIVYKERHVFFAQSRDDIYTLALVAPTTKNSRGPYVCISMGDAKRLGYRGGV